MYSPELTQLAVAGSKLTVVSHVALPHSFLLKPPVVLLVLHQQTQQSCFPLFCPLIGLYIRVLSPTVLISTSMLLLVVSPGDQKPRQVQRTARHDAKSPHNVDKSVRVCVQPRGPRLEAAHVGSSVNEWDVLVFLLYVSTSRESLMPREKCLFWFNTYIYACFCVCFHFFGSCSVRGRVATGEQRSQRQGRAHGNMHTHPPTLTHSHVSWCINEHPYFFPPPAAV